MEIAQARKRRIVFLILLAVAFLFRLGFGVCSEFWNADEKQVYLIGLKYYTTGAWPYFGPDVASAIQIPGALQGLTAGPTSY
jgi:predicted membrane-bound mannosyltransferase